MTRSRATRALTILAMTAAVTVGGLTASVPAIAATPVCGTSTAPAGFTTKLCITAPAANAFVTGKVPVTVTVTVTGTAPAVNGVQYTLDGAHLLFAFQSPYSFTMHTYLSSVGSHQFGASVVFSGGYATPVVTESLWFLPATAPTIAPFQPALGTTPAPGQPLVLAAAGDGATGLTAEKQVTDLIASWNPNLMMYLGDVYQEGTPEEFLNWYGENGSYYSQFRSITDPAPGNHEYTTNRADPFFTYWGGPPDNYSFNTHGWHMISLDDAVNIGQDLTTSAQYRWLEQDLQQNSAQCTLVEWHRPVYSLDEDEEATNFSTYWQLFNQYHVTMVVSGHSHNYQRWLPLDANGNVSPTGVSEFVVGTGGNWISPFTDTDPRAAAGADTTATAWGALKLGLSTNGATFQFQNIAGNTIDFGSLPCRGAADSVAPSAPSALTATPVSGREIDLKWTGSTDNVGVTSYRILRNGVAVGTAPGYKASFADTTVTAGLPYVYTVVAVDGAGNSSAPSAPVSVGSPSAAPTFVQSAAGSTSTKVSSLTVQLGQPVRAGDTLVGWFGQYDAAGNVQVSDPVNGAWTRVQGEHFSSGNGDVAMYYVKSAAAPTGLAVTVAGATPTYLQATVADYFGVAAAGVIATSAVAKGVSTAADSGLTAAAPAGSVVFAGLVTGGSPGSVTPGSTAGKPFTVRSNNASKSVLGADVISSAAGAQHGVFTLGAVTDWYAGAVVLRATSTGDSTPPSVPSGVTATANGPTSVTTSWSASSDDVGVVGYTVYRNGTSIADVGPTTLTYTDTAAAPGTTYSYTVAAYDAAGNRSAASTPATVTTGTPAAGYVQAAVMTTGAKLLSTSVALSKAVSAGDLLVGWFGQYDSAGQVAVSDSVNGAWTRVQGEHFNSGGGDVALYYVKSAPAAAGLTVTMSSTSPTYLQGAVADYGGAAPPGTLTASSIGAGSGTAANSGSTTATPAGALVIGALITGGNPSSAVPGASAGITMTARVSTSSGSVGLADVVTAAAGAQNASYTLAAATDWYAACAVFGP